MIDEFDLRDAIRDLKDDFHHLDEFKWETVTKPKPERKTKPYFTSETPTPDNDWSLNLEDCLLNERHDDTIPGGLLVMAHDALSYTVAGDRTITPRTGGMVCAHLWRNAAEIAEKFPAAEDLLELLREQSMYLRRQFAKRDRHGDTMTAIPADTMATGFGTAADLAPLVSAAIGHHVDRKQITYWGRSGRITAYTQPDGTTQYRLDQTITAAHEYVDKRTSHTKA